MIARFSVIGTPATKGSTRSFVRGGRVVTTNANTREKPWAQQVHWTAREHAPETPWEGAVCVHLAFRMPRPARLGKTRSMVICDRRPDIDKMTRSVLDALTGVFYVDDAQIACVVAWKRYADFGEAAGVEIAVHRDETECFCVRQRAG